MRRKRNYFLMSLSMSGCLEWYIEIYEKTTIHDFIQHSRSIFITIRPIWFWFFCETEILPWFMITTFPLQKNNNMHLRSALKATNIDCDSHWITFAVWWLIGFFWKPGNYQAHILIFRITQEDNEVFCTMNAYNLCNIFFGQLSADGFLKRDVRLRERLIKFHFH